MMEIRIANIAPEIYKAVSDEAQANERSMAKQVVLILKKHYGLEGLVKQRKPRKPKVKKQWPTLKPR